VTGTLYGVKVEVEDISFAKKKNNRGCVIFNAGLVAMGEIAKGQNSRLRDFYFAKTTDFYILDSRAGIFKKSMGARHRGGIGFSYRPARLHRLVEFIPWNPFRGPINI
jgi:hypothetical protein